MQNPLKDAKTLNAINDVVIQCRKCPRLVHFRENVPVRKPFAGQCYWKRPVPGFGDPHATLLITGLAPAAQGGTRTGRILTGDATARFLFKVLFAAGISNQPTSESKEDGLKLMGCYLTAAVKCTPPHDKPTLQEILNCSVYYEKEIGLLTQLTDILVLGKIAFDAFKRYAKKSGVDVRGWHFSHGACYVGTCDAWKRSLRVHSSYHPSPRNTNTGRLKESMLLELITEIKKGIDFK